MMMNLNLDERATKGRIQVTSDLRFPSHQWVYGWFRNDRLGVWYKATYRAKWGFLADINQVKDFQPEGEYDDEEAMNAACQCGDSNCKGVHVTSDCSCRGFVQ